VYSTNLPEACHFITTHSKAGVVCVDSNKQLEKYLKEKMVDPNCQCPELRTIVMWDEVPRPDIIQKLAASNISVYSWDQFLDLGAAVTHEEIEKRHSMIKPGNCSTLIYTSGTTGPPKAVMISHDNLTWTVQKVVDQLGNLGHTDRFISYLPLSHIAAQMIDIHAPMNIGCCTYFAQLDALKGSLKHTLTDVRPTIFFGVPRVWEKFQEAMVELGRKNPAILQWLSAWAKGLGRGHSELAQYGAGGGAPCMYSCA
jgi:long-chain-fatty-acid--CoA ligase ACSBG